MTEVLDKYPATKLVRFTQGAILFEEGSKSREMYILRSGRVRVSITKNGRSVPITELGKGCHVGEMSFIASIPRTATVTALETVIANRISPDVISGDALSISGWAISIARVLVERIKRTTDQLGDYMANGPHPYSAESSLNNPGKTPVFTISQSLSEGTIKLSGILNKIRIDEFKETVRKSLARHPDGIIIDFSGIIDIDTDVLGYLVQLSTSPQAKDGKIQLRNMQLIRNKVSSMKEIQNLIESTKPPSRRLEAGEYLIKQGERERSMFVIRSGELDILDEREGYEPIKLGRAIAGDVVGEMSLLKEGVRSASVRAVKPSLVSEITPKEFYNNIYTVPDWFMHIIDGLVVRLRNTNEMLEHVTSIGNRVEEETVMTSPLTIELDASMPGRFLLAGTLTLANMEFLVPMIRHLMYSGQKEITIKMDKIEKIDKESIRYLLNLYMVLKENGGSLNLVGTQKQLLWLKEQHAENRIAGFAVKDEIN